MFSISDADFYSQRVSQNILKDIENHSLILKENRHNEVDMWVSYMAFVFDLNFKSSYLFIEKMIIYIEIWNVYILQEI